MKNVKITFQQALGFWVVTLVFTYFFVYSFAKLSEEQRVACREIVIAIIGMGSLILNFIFGSSSSSAKKDEMIHQALNNSGSGNTTVANVETVNIAGNQAEYDAAKSYKKGDKVKFRDLTFEALEDAPAYSLSTDPSPLWRPVQGL